MAVDVSGYVHTDAVVCKKGHVQHKKRRAHRVYQDRRPGRSRG